MLDRSSLLVRPGPRQHRVWQRLVLLFVNNAVPTYVPWTGLSPPRIEVLQVFSFILNLFPYTDEFRSISVQGKAALSFRVKNAVLERLSMQLMVTGAYTIQEMSCKNCDAYLGWRMVRAHEPDEKWKEGKYILELHLLAKQQPIAAKRNPEDVMTKKQRRRPAAVSCHRSFKFANFMFSSSHHAFDMDTSWLEVR